MYFFLNIINLYLFNFEDFKPLNNGLTFKKGTRIKRQNSLIQKSTYIHTQVSKF